jgi:hypothetical protein
MNWKTLLAAIWVVLVVCALVGVIGWFFFKIIGLFGFFLLVVMLFVITVTMWCINHLAIVHTAFKAKRRKEEGK